MIYKGGIEMSARYYGLKAVTAVYKGAKNTDGWKN